MIKEDLILFFLQSIIINKITMVKVEVSPDGNDQRAVFPF